MHSGLLSSFLHVSWLVNKTSPICLSVYKYAMFIQLRHAWTPINQGGGDTPLNNDFQISRHYAPWDILHLKKIVGILPLLTKRGQNVWRGKMSAYLTNVGIGIIHIDFVTFTFGPSSWLWSCPRHDVLDWRVVDLTVQTDTCTWTPGENVASSAKSGDNQISKNG